MSRLGWYWKRIWQRVGETLNRMTTALISLGAWFSGKKTSTEHLDYDQLDEAYRQYPFIRTIVKLSASMLLANGLDVRSEDEKAEEELNRFWSRNWGRLRKAARDGALYGDAYMVPYWDEERGQVRLGVRHPGQVQPILDTLNPDVVEEYEIVVQSSTGSELRQTVTREKITVKKNNREDPEHPDERNPYGIIPVVRVTEDALSNEVYGTGDIDEVVYDFAEMYKDLILRAFDSESYHGAPVPCATGVNPKDLDEKELGTRKALATENKDANFFFLESKRGTEGAQGLLKMLYHALIGQSRTPEYLLGVHMNAAHASTKEQRVSIEMKTEERRDYWVEGIQDVNRVVLAMLEFHNGMRFSTKDTDVEWGPIFEKDKKEEAETDKAKSEALANQMECRITSRKTAIGMVHEDAEGELEEIEKEEEESRKDEGQSK